LGKLNPHARNASNLELMVSDGSEVQLHLQQFGRIPGMQCGLRRHSVEFALTVSSPPLSQCAATSSVTPAFNVGGVMGKTHVRHVASPLRVVRILRKLNIPGGPWDKIGRGRKA